jgi:acetyl-CoA acetyltransferase family protein
MHEAVIVDVIRTPSGRGKPGGQLSGIHAVDLLAGLLETLVQRSDLDPDLIDDVIAGCVSHVGEQAYNIARNAALAAGFPEHVPGTTIDRQCGSSQQAAMFAAQGVMTGQYDIAIACGVESMSRIPLGTSNIGMDRFGTKLRARYPEGLVNQGVSAELIAKKWGFDRTALDEFSARSHRLAVEARDAFATEIVPTEGHTIDETVRESTTVEGLAGLNPAFRTDELAARFPDIDWSITPGNSSPFTDGASAVLITSAERASQLGLAPRARFHAFSVTGSDILTEEIFGPVLSIASFKNEADAVAMANATEYGLIGYVYTQDLARGQRMIDAIDTGMMGLNVGVASNAAAPFGGVKQSGLGREGGFEGIHEYLSTKYTLTPAT